MTSVSQSPVSRAMSRIAPVMIEAMLPTCVAADSVITCRESFSHSNWPTMSSSRCSELPVGLYGSRRRRTLRESQLHDLLRHRPELPVQGARVVGQPVLLADRAHLAGDFRVP